MAMDEDLLLILGSSVLGDGEPDLGEKLMTAFLSMLFKSGRVPARIICTNSGVLLTTEGKSVLELLEKFKNSRKWTTRMADTFSSQGRQWNAAVVKTVKAGLAEQVAASPGTSLISEKSSLLASLFEALESKLENAK